MKFSELKSKVEDLGYRVYVDNNATIIGTKDHGWILLIKNYQCGLMSYYDDATYLEPDSLLALQKLAYKYSRTPIDERADEPKFRVKMFPESTGYLGCYLYLDDESNDITIFGDEAGTLFTQSEYDKLQQKYPEWLPKFDKNDPHFEFVEDD
ncbi:hypothetical protein [Lentilactobacillus buchneri]|uniref:hypothetical protein n=1 Tax=Lentilactobacillus buchneri TaxID=1581 RepID=UPI0005CB1C74|nr:hypothetical protein [Lentilactobacillus buchneri]MCT2901797.1 hypothetical protein [Lentilactobacillus buchneri]